MYGDVYLFFIGRWNFWVNTVDSKGAGLPEGVFFRVLIGELVKTAEHLERVV